MKRPSVYDLKRSVDSYGREIWVEKEREYDGWPVIWYKVDEKGIVRQFKRHAWGVNITRIGKAPYI